LTAAYILWYNYIKENERKKDKMVFVDIYDDATNAHIASFDLEFDWQYKEVIAVEDELTERGIKFFEITTYQED
jgi:hypothetical protein